MSYLFHYSLPLIMNSVMVSQIMSYKIGFSIVIFTFFCVGGAGCHSGVSYNDYFLLFLVTLLR